MTVSEALRGVTRLGLDTAPIIYYVERVSPYFDLCLPIFTSIASGHIEAVTSTMTLTETLPPPLRLNDTLKAEAFRTMVLRSRGVEALPLSAAIAEQAGELRARYRLRTPDATQLATAFYSGSDAFLANDRDLRRVTELPIIVLGELTT